MRKYKYLLLLTLSGSMLAAAMPARAADPRVSSGQFERLDRLIGSQVLTSDRQLLGKLNNLILDLESGHVLFAVVGNGTQRAALPPGVFSELRGDSLYLNINKDRFNSAPRIQGRLNREEAMQASFVNKVYQAFNQPAWWQGSTPPDQGTFHNVQAGEHLNGMQVLNVQDKLIGQVRDAVIDLPAGRIVYVVLEPDRSLALPDKLYAVPPMALGMYKSADKLEIDTDQQKLSSGPSFDKNQWPSLGDRSFASRVYEHYGKQAYFEGANQTGLAPTGNQSSSVYQNDNWSSPSTSSSSSNSDWSMPSR